MKTFYKKGTHFAESAIFKMHFTRTHIYLHLLTFKIMSK